MSLIRRNLVIWLVVVNAVLSVVFLVASLYLMSTVMNAFDRIEPMSGFEKWLFDLGGVLARYFVALAYVLPEPIQRSAIGGVASFLSAFIMTIPVTVLGCLLVVLWRRKTGECVPRNE